jgi:hypothetical protein
MKPLAYALLTVAMVAASHAAGSADRDPQYDKLVAGLQRQIEFLRQETIKEELTPAQVWEESEKEWTMVMKNFRAKLAELKLEGRDDIVRGKEQVHESWKRRCQVLLDQLSEKGAVLRRYDEGVDGSTGYAILVDGKPKFWLHRRFNRDRDNY